ncbi:hypothetical protein Tco_0237837 [Tanacetum coccineum]
MASFDYRLNPVFTIKECSSCGAWYNKSCGCSKKGFVDKFVIDSNKTPDLSQQPPNCPKCGNPVEGLYCRQCALIRKKLEEVSQDFQDTSESSNDNPDIVDAPQEPFVFNQDPGENSLPSPPQIDHCCHECGDSLDGIFCRRCTCKSCGKGAHYGYNCPPKAPIISNPEPCKNQTIESFGLEPISNPPNIPSILKMTSQFSTISLMEQMTSYVIWFGPNYAKEEEEKAKLRKSKCPKIEIGRFPFAIGLNDEGDTIAITPFYQSRHDNSLSMGDEHLDTIPATESDEVIKSSVEDLVPIPSESEGVPKMCDVPLCENTTPLNALNEHSEIVVNSNDDNSSSDDDSTYGEDIDYVDASPLNVEIVSLEVVEIIVPEVERIDDDILLTIKDDILREKLLNINLLIAKIDALRNNPTPSFDVISSGSPTTRSDLSLPDYKAFYVDNDHFKEKSSGSTTTHVDCSRYDSFIFDLSNAQFPPADRSDFHHEEFADELTHIMSLPNLECFKFKIEPDPEDLTSIDPGIRKNAFTTNVNVPLGDDQSPLFAYVVWIFLAFLMYPVVPPYLPSTKNEDTIFDPGISIYHSLMPDVSHRSGTFMKFNEFPDCEDSRALSFILHPQEFHILSFILGIHATNLFSQAQFRTPTASFNNNNQMSMEDSLHEDSIQTPSPAIHTFAPASAGKQVFASGTLTPSLSNVPFIFGVQTNQPPSQIPFQVQTNQPPSQNPFQVQTNQPPSQNPFQVQTNQYHKGFCSVMSSIATTVVAKAWKLIFTKGRKTKPKSTKLGTEWKSVKRRSQIEAKKPIKSKSQQKSQTDKVKVKRKLKSEEI